MKRRKKAAMIFAAVILYCCMMGQQIVAAAASQDGLLVKLSGDKEKYAQGESVTATLTVTNTNRDAVANILLEQLDLDGYKAAEDDSTVKHVMSLAGGETTSLSVTYVPENADKDNGSTEGESGGGSADDTDKPGKDTDSSDGGGSGNTDKPDKDTASSDGGGSGNTDDRPGRADVTDSGDSAGITQELTLVSAPLDHNGAVRNVAAGSDKTGNTGLRNAAFNPGDPKEVPSAGRSRSSTGTTAELGEASAQALAVSENSHVVWCMLILLFFGIVLVVLAVGRKYRKRILSLFLCTVLAVGLMPDNCVKVLAAETERNSKKISISSSIKVGENDVVLGAYVSYDGEEVSDVDNDGVSDYVEDYFGTDSSKEDTDGDGLSDEMEIYTLKTDPLLKDTDGNGTADGDEDTDGDGLSNLSEVAYGTDPVKEDTDGDGLGDCEEIETYGTDPLLYDTDGDGISDGNEALLGLNPRSQSTDGSTKDSDRTFAQTLSRDLIDESLIKAGNEMIPSIAGTVSDNINQHVSVDSVDIPALSDNRAVIGEPLSVLTDYGEHSGLKLQFDCSGVSDRTDFLIICTYQDGRIVPCETSVSEDTIACDAASGYYFVADAEKLLSSLGISLEAYTSPEPVAAISALRGTGSNEVPEEWYKENYILTDENGNVVEETDTKENLESAAETESSVGSEDKKPEAGTKTEEKPESGTETEDATESIESTEKPESGTEKEESTELAEPAGEKPESGSKKEESIKSAGTTEEEPASEATEMESTESAEPAEQKAASDSTEAKGTEPEKTEEEPASEAEEIKSTEETESQRKTEEGQEIVPEQGHYVLAESSRLAAVSNAKAGYERKEVLGQADIVFVIDSTGSMSSAINNVVKNIDTFVDTLDKNYSVQANFALIDFKDITCGEETGLVKNGSSNWFTDVATFKSRVGSIFVSGGGDEPETPIDGLAMAGELDFRQNADKFIILITDTYYKTDNHYGISSMQEMIEKFSSEGIVTSVISNPIYETQYRDLYNTTGGVFGDIYGDFYLVLLKLADNIGQIVNDGTWVILSDYQYVKLKAPVSAESGMDSDGDGVSDYIELGTPVTWDLTDFLKKTLEAYEVPFELYKGETSITTYQYVSNPVLVDSDFDGKNDGTDAAPLNNQFSGKLKTNYAASQVSFDMDYRWFFEDQTIYHDKLSVVSLLFSSAVYHENALNITDSLNEDTTSGSGIKEIMEYFGLDGAKTYSLDTMYSDNHLSEAAIGHHTVTYNGETKTVLAVTIRGTNGTIQEWSSNFDIGNASDFGSIAEWTIENNHEGFDVAANRIIRLIRQYISDNGLDASNLSYWVTGHSRGAAIANIVGANLESGGKRAYTYTFASPNTTMAEDAASYKSIFNIVNADDFVPCLPMAAWGYTRYGRTASSGIAANYEKEWESLTGIWDYNPDTFGMQKTVSSLAAILSGDPRAECYKYTCDCHGDSSDDTITVTNYGMSMKSREDAIAKIPVNALPYCILTRYDGGWISGWDFDNCQTPAYFMQILAAQMSGEISAYRFVAELDTADRYKAAKRAIISSAIGGLEHPHYTESYYVLSKNLKAAEFK